MITLHAVTRLLLIKEITHPHLLTCFPLLDGGLVAQPTQGADLGPSGDNEPNLRLIQAYPHDSEPLEKGAMRVPDSEPLEKGAMRVPDSEP